MKTTHKQSHLVLLLNTALYVWLLLRQCVVYAFYLRTNWKSLSINLWFKFSINTLAVVDICQKIEKNVILCFPSSKMMVSES